MEFFSQCIHKGHEQENTLGFCFNQKCSQSPEFCFTCLEDIQQSHSSNCLRFKAILQIILDSYETLGQLRIQISVQHQNINHLFKNISNYILQEEERLRNLFDTLNMKNYNKAKKSLNEYRDCIQNKVDSQFQESITNQIKLKIQEIEIIFEKIRAQNFRNHQNSDQQWKIQDDEELAEKQIQELEEDTFVIQQNLVIASQLAQEAKQLFDQNNFDEALKKIDESLQFDKENDEIYFIQGSILFTIKRETEALQQIEKCLKLNPKCSEAFYIKGQILKQLGKNLEALECLKICADCPKSINYQNYEEIAQISSRLGRHEDAIKYCDLAIDLDNRFSEAYNLKAIACQQVGKYELARQSYDFALQYSNENPHYLKNKGKNISQILAVLLQSIKQYNEALICYTQAINQKNKLTLNIYEQAVQGKLSILLNLKRYEEALQFINEIIVDEPQNIELINSKIQILRLLGRNSEADNFLASIKQN